MGLLRTRTRIASPLSREHSPVKWYAAPLSINGFPFRFPRSQETLRKIIRACTRTSSCVDPLYLFKCITFPNRYWKESVGWPRARPVGRAPDCLNYQLQHLDLARVPAWIEGAAQVRQRNLRYPVTQNPWRQDDHVWRHAICDARRFQFRAMSSSPRRIGGAVPRDWKCQFPQFEKSLRALEPARLGIPAHSLTLTSRQQSRNRPATGVRAAVPTPTMAMSSDQQVTVALPTHELEAEPMRPRAIGEHAAELTSDTALVQPIADLIFPEDVSDSETIVTVVSPRRRASVSSQKGETPDETTKERVRRSSTP